MSTLLNKKVEIRSTNMYNSIKEDKHMDIGDRIRARREELGMSQDELARAAGYKSRSSINKIEMDGRGLPQPKIVAIAKALHVSPAYLMGWEDGMSEDWVKFVKEDGEILALVRRAMDESFRKRLLKFVKMMEEYDKEE
jgi:transcriptional regulator with XRE-family HTH domain